MFRDDETARAEYLAALERKAARVEVLEQRIRELETENRQLHASGKSPSPSAQAGLDGAEMHVDVEPAEMYVDDKVHLYAAALVAATDPRLIEGILSGARTTDAALLIDDARRHAITENRRFLTPTDVRRSALEILPTKVLMKDPDADPHGVVRTILAAVDVP
ncbi:MAG: hypothetical protein ACKV2T_08005 [Kofleriaceae bacterium]